MKSFILFEGKFRKYFSVSVFAFVVFSVTALIEVRSAQAALSLNYRWETCTGDSGCALSNAHVGCKIGEKKSCSYESSVDQRGLWGCEPGAEELCGTCQNSGYSWSEHYKCLKAVCDEPKTRWGGNLSDSFDHQYAEKCPGDWDDLTMETTGYGPYFTPAGCTNFKKCEWRCKSGYSFGRVRGPVGGSYYDGCVPCSGSGCDSYGGTCSGSYVTTGDEPQVKSGPLGIGGLFTAFSGLRLGEGQRLMSVASPIASTDAATKEYVDAEIARRCTR